MIPPFQQDAYLCFYDLPHLQFPNNSKGLNSEMPVNKNKCKSNKMSKGEVGRRNSRNFNMINPKTIILTFDSGNILDKKACHRICLADAQICLLNSVH
jgi:hypothetical protein